MNVSQVLVYGIIVLAFLGIAVGRLPRLAMNRTSIALAAAILLIEAGGIGAEEAFAAVDIETIALLLAMMLLVANLRQSGFFDVAGAKIVRMARSPRIFLGIVVFASGFLSALFLNDTICIMLTPLVAQIARRSGRDGKPYLIALATAANAGSCATAIGNPQNMLIASRSGIPFVEFVATLAPPSILAMVFCYLFTLVAFRKEFTDSAFHIGGPGEPWVLNTDAVVDRQLMVKSLAASALLLVLLALGLRTSVASLAAACVLLITRRINPERIFAGVDLSLLVFFSGLFILTRTVGKTPLFVRGLEAVLPVLDRPGILFAAVVTLVSNLVSNVPAVMLLSPVAQGFSDPATGWLMLAMASTYAGNLTLLGSVANLIVAEEGKKAGILVGFADYLKVGLPVTLASVAAGTGWIMMMRG